MKRIISLFLCLALICICLCGCQGNEPTIEKQKWKLLTVQIDNEGSVVACRGELLNIYSGAQIIYISIEASNGVLTLVDYTGDEDIVYTGTYAVDEDSKAGGFGVSAATYIINIDGIDGSAIVTTRQTFSGKYTSMIIYYDGYAINCEPMSK